jgi:hypothetical protein
LYEFEAWSVTLREGHGLRIFLNTVLRKTVRPKRDDVTGAWRKLHKEELCDLHSTPNVIRVINSRTVRRAAHVARMGIEEVHTGFNGDT